MTPQPDRNSQPQVHENAAHPDDVEDTLIIMATPPPIAPHALTRRRDGDAGGILWSAGNQDGTATPRTYHLPALPLGPSQMQRRWHLAPGETERETGALAEATRDDSVTMTQRYRLATHPVTHAEQSYTLSMAAQMLAQESPISAQGPPSHCADPPWTNDAPGMA